MEPFSAFPSWFLRIECDRCGKVQMVNESHAKWRDRTLRDILAKMRHDGCGGQGGAADRCRWRLAHNPRRRCVQVGLERLSPSIPRMRMRGPWSLWRHRPQATQTKRAIRCNWRGPATQIRQRRSRSKVIFFSFTGQPAEARRAFTACLRLDPRGPLSAWMTHLTAISVIISNVTIPGRSRRRGRRWR